jgi:hypothetical protein
MLAEEAVRDYLAAKKLGKRIGNAKVKEALTRRMAGHVTVGCNGMSGGRGSLLTFGRAEALIAIGTPASERRGE